MNPQTTSLEKLNNNSPVSYNSPLTSLDQLRLPEIDCFFSNHEGSYPGALNPPSNCHMKSSRGHLRWLLSQAGGMALPSNLEINDYRELSQKNGYDFESPIFYGIESSIEEQFRQLEQAGVQALQVFAPTHDLLDSHKKSGVKFQIDSLSQNFLVAVDSFGDKVQLAHILQNHKLSANFPQLLFGYNSGTLEKLNNCSANEIEEYSKAVAYHRGGERALFVQRANASGGRGNFLVRFKEEFNCYLWPDGQESSSIQEVIYRAIEIGKNSKDSIRIAPFLNILDTYSVGVKYWNKNDFVLFGTRQQILDKENTFIGFNYRNGIDSETESYIKKFLDLISITCPNFQGSFGIDFATFKNPYTQNTELFIAEVNMRLDGTMPLSQLVLRYHAKEWIKGELHIAQLDSVETNISDPSLLFARLSKELPLYSPANPYGLVIMTPPLKAANMKTYVCIGVVTNSQSESDQLLTRASLCLRN